METETVQQIKKELLMEVIVQSIIHSYNRGYIEGKHGCERMVSEDYYLEIIKKYLEENF